MLNKMKECRIKKGLSMTQLSMKSGISERYLYFIEKGEKNPSLSTANSIAKALDSTVDVLFFNQK